MKKLETISQILEQYMEKVHREVYLNLSGQKETCELSPIFEANSSIFTPEIISRLREAVSNEDPERQKRAKYLLRMVLEGYLQGRCKELVDLKSTTEAQATISIEGKQIPFRQATTLNYSERDQVRRKLLFEAGKPVREQLNELQRQTAEREQGISRELGFPHYLALYQETSLPSLRALVQEMDSFCRKTREKYEELMARVIPRELGIAWSQFGEYDVARLRRGDRYDHFFKDDRLDATLKETLSGMGIQLSDLPNISIDGELRPRKYPRACVITIRIPEEVVILYNPTGGYKSYHELFHESGHALHFGTTDRSLPFEYKEGGDGAVSEGYAFLMDNLLLNPDWWRVFIGGDGCKEYMEFAYALELHLLRNYTARLKGDMALYNGQSTGEKDRQYAQFIKEYLGFDYSLDRVYYQNDSFYGACYLRAWIFEAQMRDYLKRNYGPRWFQSKEAGRLVKEFWGYGTQYTVEELASRLGYQGLDTGPLLAEFLG
ncbi:MAG: hypothetical protein HYU64_03580 [Armatimonadetes bacterium]|nr:hypothetical protein [Armatimonadota bacterium]